MHVPRRLRQSQRGNRDGQDGVEADQNNNQDGTDKFFQSDWHQPTCIPEIAVGRDGMPQMVRTCFARAGGANQRQKAMLTNVRSSYGDVSGTSA